MKKCSLLDGTQRRLSSGLVDAQASPHVCLSLDTKSIVLVMSCAGKFRLNSSCVSARLLNGNIRELSLSGSVEMRLSVLTH